MNTALILLALFHLGIAGCQRGAGAESGTDHPGAAAVRVRAIEERWSYVDASRIAIWGWSGGGSMSLNAIFRYPELYRTAMAIAFVCNQRFYDTVYQERYMGLPASNEAGFTNGSPITFAHQLKGNLLLVYGTGDDNNFCTEDSPLRQISLYAKEKVAIEKELMQLNLRKNYRVL
jgi:dienelactone hydrolase